MEKNKNWSLLNNISSLLERQSLTINEASEKLGVNRNSISNFLNGRSCLTSSHFVGLLKLGGVNLGRVVEYRLEKGDLNETSLGEDMDCLLSKLSKNQKKVFIKDLIKSVERVQKIKKEDINNKSFFRLKEFLRENY